jgi:membrane fusion protein
MPAEPLFTATSLLFRQQQNIGHARLLGPPHLSSLALLIGVIVSTAGVFLVTNNYARKASVPGYLEYSITTKRIYAERPGRIERLQVIVGQRVQAGQLLAIISTSLPQQIEHGNDALADYERLLTQQHKAREVLAADNDTQLEKIKAQLTALGQAITLQREMLALQELKAAQTLQIRAASLALLQRAQISRLSFSELEERWYSSQQVTTELKANLANLQAQQVQLQITLANNPTTRRAGLLQIDTEIARLEQARNNQQRELRQEIRAPIQGRIANVMHEAGENITPGMPLLSLEPSDGTLQARLMIASHAIGFIEPGQAVNLLYDAFPYQQFGSFPGQVLDVSRHPLTALDETDLPRDLPPVYLARIALLADHVNAYGESVALREGMTLKADIVLESRSLLDWLFEPLLIMRGRGGG